jgi:hypothetical protein
MRAVVVVAVLSLFAVFAQAAEVLEVQEIAPVWAGHPVGFCLLTVPPLQYVAYYDWDRNMVVAQRDLGSNEWRRKVLPERVGWDSHNSIVMALDDNGRLHVTGNMHVHPLKYFITETAGDVLSLVRVPALVGTEEQRMTYPDFFRGPDGRLIFTYRDGKSGSGNQIYNVYDAQALEWRRLLDQPLTDGRGEMNAYLHGPVKGPDGFYHLCWVWRDTPDCATNHDLSYARSRDLVQWEKSDGTPVTLPMTAETAEVIDPVPPGGGMINGNAKIGFDQSGRVVVSYHKYDGVGNTQIYNARVEDGTWKIRQTSNWDSRWEFEGGGTINFEVGVHPVRVDGDQLLQGFSFEQEGSGTWLLDPETLQAVDTLPSPPSPYPAELTKVESEFPGMQVNWRGDTGNSGESGVVYTLRWETLDRNRDKPRPQPWPEPSMLRLYKLQR